MKSSQAVVEESPQRSFYSCSSAGWCHSVLYWILAARLNGSICISSMTYNSKGCQERQSKVTQHSTKAKQAVMFL